MRKAIPSMLVTMFILIGSLHSALAAPYWVKPGVYIEYIAKRYDPYFPLVTGARPEQIHTAEIFLEVNGTLFKISAHNDTRVRFEFLNEERGYLTVRATIEMTNVTLQSTFLNNISKYPVFWNPEDVISEELIPNPDYGFLDCVWLRVQLNKLNIFGIYQIRVRDGAVFDRNGNYYGHTFLWIEPGDPPMTNETFSIRGNVTNTVWKTGNLNRPLMTYYGKFGPPLFSVMLTTENFKLSQRIDDNRNYTLLEVSFGGPSGGGIYDPFTGIAIYPTAVGAAPYADFYAIGIRWAVFEDELGAYRAMKEKDSLWLSGLVLYDTNAEFQKVQEVPFSKAQTPLRYMFWVSLVLLGSIVVTRGWRRPK